MSGKPAVLKVDILTDASKAKAGLADTESRFSKFGSAAAKAGKIAAAGLAVGLAAAGAAAFKLAQGAAEDEAAAARLAQTLKNTTGATDSQVASMEKWISKQGEALGVTDDELRPAIEKLAGSTGSLKTAQEQASLAMDVAAGRGLSLESVTKALEKANNGNVAGLSKLGIETKNAAGETLTLEQATGKLADKYNGQASTAAETTAGKFERLKLRMAEAGETIGGKLLPIGEKLGTWLLDKGAPAVMQLAGKLQEKLGPAFTAVGGFINDKAIPAIRNAHEWFVDKIAPGIANTLTPIINGAKNAFEKIKEKIDDNQPALQTLFDAVKKVAEFLADKVLPIIGKGVGGAFELFGTALGAGIDVIGKLVGWLDTAVGKVSSLIGWIKKIDFPSMPDWAGKLIGGTAGALTTGRMSGLATAGAGDLGALLLGAGGSSFSSTVVVDRRSFPVELRVDGAGLLFDEAGVARRLEKLLRDHAVRLGTLPTLGTA